MNDEKPLRVGIIGHVDNGKCSLAAALAQIGVDSVFVDPEERDKSDKEMLLELIREFSDSFSSQMRALIYALMRGRYYIGRRKPRKAHRNVVRKMRRKWYKGN